MTSASGEKALNFKEDFVLDLSSKLENMPKFKIKSADN